MAHTAVAKKQSEPKMSRALVRQETIAGYLFLLPSLIFFIGFVIYPMVMCIFTSFFDSSMNRADVFIGLQNYVELFHDSVFLGALRNTLIIVVVSVPITCIFSLWVASAIVNMPPWATSLFRVIFYLPVVTGSVAVTVVWKWMFNNYYGIFNYLGKSMGLLDQNINWLGDTRYALACIILILLTTSVGQPIVLYVSALTARRAAAGWIGALALPLAMYGVRAAIPATSHLNVVKYANLVSLLQTNELLGNYRNLFWFGTPIGLPLVEWTAAVFYGALFAAAFCTVFARAQLLPAAKRGLVLGLTRRTKATSIIKEEGRKLFVLNGAAVFLAAFLAFGVYQGVTSESYIDADEIYYAYYMKHISGPWTAESRDWLTAQGEEFAPMLAVQRRVARGELSNEAMLAYGALQQKYNIYQQVVQNNINYYLKEHPGAWLVYESGYKKLFGFSGTADVQDTLWAGLLCALCFSGLFAMERKGGMDEILACTPLGRKYTVKAKLRQSTAVAAVISFGTVLPHLWQVLRDYGLPSLLGPAMSISDLQAVPKFITLSDLLIFWLICRFAACLCMSRITLWLGQKLGNLLTALFISAVAYCLPALLSLSGMKNGIEWLGFYPLFHAAALWQNQGYTADGKSYNAMWIPIFLVCAAFFLAWAIGQALIDDYDMIGVPDEVL